MNSRFLIAAMLLTVACGAKPDQEKSAVSSDLQQEAIKSFIAAGKENSTTKFPEAVVNFKATNVQANMSVRDQNKADSRAEDTFLLLLSKTALEHSFEKSVRETYDESVSAGGTRIFTRGKITGLSHLELVPSASELAFDAVLVAKSSGTLTGKSTHPKANTSFTADTLVNTKSRSAFRIAGEGPVRYLQTRTSYTPSLDITGVRVRPRGLFKRAIVRAAQDKVYSHRRQMASQLGRRMAEQIAERVNQDAMQAANSNEFARLVRIRDILASTEKSRSLLSLTTEPNFVAYRIKADTDYYGVPSARGDVIIRFHQDSVNELLTVNSAGKTLSANELKAEIAAIFANTDGPSGSVEDVSLVMRKENPVTLNAEDGRLEIRIGLEQIIDHDEIYDYELDIAVNYHVIEEDGYLGLRREGEITIYPPGFVPGVDLLTRRQKIVIDELKREFGTLFSKELVTNKPAVHPSGKDLVLNGLVAERGWFMLSYLLR